MRFGVSRVLDAIETRLTTDPLLARAVLDLAEVVRLVDLDLDTGKPATLLRVGHVIDALASRLTPGPLPARALAAVAAVLRLVGRDVDPGKRATPLRVRRAVDALGPHLGEDGPGVYVVARRRLPSDLDLTSNERMGVR